MTVPVISVLSLKQRVFKAGSWTFAGVAFSQVLRFGTNLVLTRLLFPEAFGLMAIIFTVMIGLTMLSDLGVVASIVRRKEPPDRAFLSTAWVMQIAKGVLVALLMLALSPLVAAHYAQPALETMMPVAGLVALISGFGSTKIAMAQRNVDAARLTSLEVGSQVAGAAMTIVLAWLYPDPWSLVWGNLFGSMVKLVASHVCLKGPSDRLGWDPQAARTMFSFGGGVLLSSMLTFMVGEGNKLLSASLLDIRLVGLMGLASGLNLIAWQFVQQISSRVLFPAYSEVVRSDPSRLSRVLERARIVQIVPTWFVALFFLFFGSAVIGFLYDARYADASYLLKLGAASMMVSILSGSYAGVLWALGKVGLSVKLLATQVAFQWVGMLVGAKLGGPLGVVVGGAAGNWLLYPVTALVYQRLGLFHWRVDLTVIAASVGAVTLMVWTTDWSRALAW